MALQFHNQQYNKTSFLEMTCELCSNENCLLKRNLKSEDTLELSYQKKEIKCKKGQQFIIEGASVTGLFFVLKGKVKVFRTGINGREQIVRFASAGDIIGHRGFGTEEYYSIGAMALEDTVLCYFSKAVLQNTLLKDPIFMIKQMPGILCHTNIQRNCTHFISFQFHDGKKNSNQCSSIIHSNFIPNLQVSHSYMSDSIFVYQISDILKHINMNKNKI